MIKKSATFFTLKLRRNICKIIIGIARRDRYKIFTTKNNFKGENSYKNYIKNISIFVRLATAKPVFFQRTQDPCKGERHQTRSGLVMSRKRKNNTGIPDFEIDSLARALLPAIQKLFETEEGKQEFEEWQAERQKSQLNKKQNKESH